MTNYLHITAYWCWPCSKKSRGRTQGCGSGFSWWFIYRKWGESPSPSPFLLVCMNIVIEEYVSYFKHTHGAHHGGYFIPKALIFKRILSYKSIGFWWGNHWILKHAWQEWPCTVTGKVSHGDRNSGARWLYFWLSGTRPSVNGDTHVILGFWGDRNPDCIWHNIGSDDTILVWAWHCVF